MLFPKIQFPGSLSISTACSILGKWPLSRSTRLPPSSPREKILYRARAAPRVIGLIIGAVASIAVTIYVQNFTVINTFLHAFLAFVTSIVVGYAASTHDRATPQPHHLGPRPGG